MIEVKVDGNNEYDGWGLMSVESVVLMSIYVKDELKLIRESVDSLLNQTYTDFNLHIGIDGPVGEDVKKYLKGIYDCRVFVNWYEGNCGLANVLNKLLGESLISPYKYIFRMDADDVSLSSRMFKQVLFLERNNDVDILGGAFIEFDDFGREKIRVLPSSHDQLISNFIRKSPFCHPTVVFRRRVFDSGLRYDENYILAEDYMLWLQAANQGFRFANIEEPLIRYRISKDTIRRRRGFVKSYDEAKIRFIAMKQLKLFSVRNMIVTVLVFVIRLCPPFLVAVIYKWFR